MKALILKEYLKLSHEGAGVIAEVGSAVRRWPRERPGSTGSTARSRDC